MAKKETMRLEASGQFGTAFYRALSEQDLSLVYFARMIDANYEHLRKSLKGITTPSKDLLPRICKPLGLNVDEMKTLVVHDQMEKKWGKKAVAAAALRALPYGSEFAALMPQLSEEDILSLLGQMRAMVKNRELNCK